MAGLKLVSALDPAAQPALLELDARLRNYYNAPEIGAYYGLHHARNLRWEEGSEHAVIRHCAVAGTAVVDLGCGSAHSFVNLRDSGVRYTGVDISRRQVEANRAEFGGADGAGGGAEPLPLRGPRTQEYLAVRYAALPTDAANQARPLPSPQYARLAYLMLAELGG